MSSRRAVLFAVALCDLAMMCLAIAVNLLPVYLTTLATDLAVDGVPLSAEQLGRVGAVTFAGVCAGIFVTGPAADRLGARLFAVGGNVLLAVGLAILGFAPDYGTVLVASFVMGLGAGALDMILSPIVSALQPERRTVAMNLLHSFYCTGAVVTILAGAVALRWGVGWRALALGLLAAPLGVGLCFLFVPLPHLVEGGTDRTPLGALLRHPFFRVTLVAIFLGGATEIGMAYWLPAYAERSLGYAPWTAGMAFVGFSVAMAVGRIAIALLPHALSPIALMLACCGASAVLFVVASFAPWSAVALAACVLSGLTGSCLWPSTLAVAADRFPRGGATMFALLAAFGNFGGIFMPWLVGGVADRSSMRWGLATGTLCPLLMIAALLWMRRHLRVAGHVESAAAVAA
jgi:fucose permease